MSKLESQASQQKSKTADGTCGHLGRTAESALVSEEPAALCQQGHQLRMQQSNIVVVWPKLAERNGVWVNYVFVSAKISVTAHCREFFEQ